MASNRYAPEGPYDPYGPYGGGGESNGYGGTYGSYGTDTYGTGLNGTGSYGTYGQYDAYGSLLTETYDRRPATVTSDARRERDTDLEPWGEWNPTEESVRPVRGRHRVNKQRGGSMARSGAVLGVGMIAAVGAGGVATAKDKDPMSISMPDMASASDTVKSLPDKLPDAKDLPGVGSLVSGDTASADDVDALAARAPLTQAGLTRTDTQAGQTDAGEALRTRILAQAQQQQSAADSSAREAAAKAAVDEAAAKAAKEHKEDAARERKAEAEKRAKAEAARLAKLARSFRLPVASYQLTSGFGDAGSLWANDHTGQDFAAPTGTPIKAVHSGTIKEAGWAGSYGYRTVLELDDGTELWFCHQSSMTVSAGEKVSTGDVIGRVGATGNVTGAHLHMEVHTSSSDTAGIDPMAWLRSMGLNP